MGCEIVSPDLCLRLLGETILLPAASLSPAEQRWLVSQIGQVSSRWIHRSGDAAALRALKGQVSALAAIGEDR